MRVAIVGSGHRGPGRGAPAARAREERDFHIPALWRAGAILKEWARGRFEIHFPRRFTVGMRLLRLLPCRLYRLAVRRFTGL